MRPRLTNEIVDGRLTGRNIKRIENYKGSRKKIKFQCLVKNCNHTWPAAPGDILSGHGCPECAGNVKLTNKEIDQRLNGRGIKRLDKYLGALISIQFKCLVKNCNHTWPAKPSDIINNNTGCPECNRPGINAKKITKILAQNNVNFEKEVKIKKFNSIETHMYFFDFYIPKYKLVIEYNGEQHYSASSFGNPNKQEVQAKLEKQQNRDEYVRKFCQDNNLTLIEIDGRKYKNKKLEKYITELITNNFIINQ